MRTDSNQVAVIGGDMRQCFLAEIFAKQGYEVMTYAICERLQNSQILCADSLKEVMAFAKMLVVPFPFLRAGEIVGADRAQDLTWECFHKYLRSEMLIYGGCFSKEMTQSAKIMGARLIDLMKVEQVALRNTVAAAEGIIAEAITRSPKNLCGSKCLVFGYGNCGGTLVQRLKGLGCYVMVHEKRNIASIRTEMTANQVVTVKELKDALSQSDFIFNTAPEQVLPKEILEHVPKECLILDMASAPGGVDFDAAKELGRKAVLLPGLPGRYAPLSSAEILAEAILSDRKGIVA